MRNILLLICFAAFTSVSAQENEIFDIKKNIENKRMEWGKILQQRKIAYPQRQGCWGRGITYSPIPTIYQLLNSSKLIIMRPYKMPVIATGIGWFQLMQKEG